MGCASSAPLVEQGKNLVEGVKDAAGETVEKGEKVLHDTTDTIKDGVSSGIEAVKETIQTAVDTAGESIGTVTQKIGDTFHLTSSKTAENLANEVQETKEHMSSSAAEAVSEAETVIMSETEHAREAFQSGTSPFFETVHSLDDDLKELETKGLGSMREKVNEMEETTRMEMDVLEDLEGEVKDHLGETVAKMEEKVEELHGDQAKTEEMEKDEEKHEHLRKEEQAPTFWEAAADAILIKKTIKHLEPLHHNNTRHERIFFPSSEKPDADLSEKNVQENDLFMENTDN